MFSRPLCRSKAHKYEYESDDCSCCRSEKSDPESLDISKLVVGRRYRESDDRTDGRSDCGSEKHEQEAADELVPHGAEDRTALIARLVERA